MAGTCGHRPRSLTRELSEAAYRFEFFQAVRLLEWVGAKDGEAAPRRRTGQPVGFDGPPKEECVRFRAPASRSFPAGAVRFAQIPPDSAGPPSWLMAVSFLGLTGPQGALPHHYTSLVIERTRRKDFALRDFLDMFNHRAVSFFYRAWTKYRFCLEYERAQRQNEAKTDDAFVRLLYSLVGFGTAGLRRRHAFDDEAFLYYAGHFAHFPRGAESLEAVLTDYFSVPVKVAQFQGRWLSIGDADRSLLPSRHQPAGQNNGLGTTMTIGHRIWDVQSKFRVRPGPLTYEQFRSFMPNGNALRPLSELVRTYAGPEFDFDVQPVLLRHEVPWCRLGDDGADPRHLGWNTWIRSGEMKQDVDDAIFCLEV